MEIILNKDNKILGMFEMNRFWDNLILPIIERVNAKYIVEIGSDNGINTRNILEYCKNNDAHMTAVDPFPKFDIKKFKDEYGDKFEIYKELSIKRLPLLKDYDVILLDGDHNWYTVYNELKILEKSFKDKKFPLIFLHDVNWPYARRDLYYNPENIPEDYRQPYKKLGMYPGQTDLKEKGGLNADLNNSIYANNPHNGVLTAVEEFIAESNLKFSFESIDAFHGLGILHIEDDATKKIVKDCIKKAQFLKILEEERVKSSIYARDKKTESKLLQERSKEMESKLKRFDELIKEKDNTIKSMKEAELLAENRHKELNLKIEDLEANFCEMSYFNNNYRSFTQRLSSKFPSLYILLKMNRRGLKNTLTTIKGYKAIKKNNLLDIGYYLKNNEDVKKSGADPILHYISHGFKEDRKPNPLFDGSYYLKSYADVRNSNLNPLIHYSLYGVHEGRNTKKKVNNEFQKYSPGQIEDILNALNSNKKVSIIIPIYNAYEDTKNCIESVLKNTKIPYELILIDDCSSDKRIKKLLTEMKKIPYVKVMQNTKNEGFVKSVNKGIKNSKGDIVLLNSDTIVTPKWLQKLVIAAYSNKKIGTVTPISNNAGAFSVPEIGKNKIPKYLTLNGMASLVEKFSEKINMEVPTGNGFCMFIKRDTINDVGMFDEKNFGKGYGEETDFSIRARYKNWSNVRNDSIFIYHKRNASFSKEKAVNLKKNNKSIIKKRYATIFSEWDDFLSSDTLQNSINKIKVSLKDLEKKDYIKRILYVTDIDNKGFPNINKGKEFSKIYDMSECTFLTLEINSLKLWEYENDEFLMISEWKIKGNWNLNDFRNIQFNLLQVLKTDILFIGNFLSYHTQKFRNHSYIVRIAQNLGLSIIYESTSFNPIKKLENSLKFDDNLNSLFKLIKEESKKINFEKNNVAVYTAITGNYDELLIPEYVNDNFDYICFTDNKDLKSDFWEIRLMEELDLDKIRKARHYKILPHLYLEEYDYSLWIDGNFRIIGNLEYFINEYAKNNKLMGIIHEERNCIYEEANACINLGKDSEEIISSQMKKYKVEGYPENQGLIASGILFRDHKDAEIIKLMEDWYKEVINHSKRDQLSFNYVCWKNSFNYDECDRHYWRNEYFESVDHKRSIPETQKSNKILSNFRKNYSNRQIEDILNALNSNKKVSIIIPIYNAYEDTKNCIESVLKNTKIPYELILIDDCSSDKRIKKLLTEMKKIPYVKVMQNTKNEGFVKSVNKGIKNSKGDIVLLNSDTIVTPKWLQKLVIAAYSNKKIGTVTPISNNAGAFSVPEIGKNKIPKYLTLNGMASLVEKFSEKINMEVPTGNGFCMFIKRDTINDVGMFDEKNFGKGYGEENDFCMRAIEKYWTNIIDDSTYIYHKGSSSFSNEKRELMKRNRAVLDKKHPSYTKKVHEFLSSKELKFIQKNVKTKVENLDLNQINNLNKKRILCVLHQGQGGTPIANKDIVTHLEKSFECYILTSTTKELLLWKCEEKQFKKIKVWAIKSKWSAKEFYNNEFRNIYFNVLNKLDIDIVHIHHLFKHTFDLPHITKKLGIPTILSFHDFYFVCPSIHLLDGNNEYCSGQCTDEHSECIIPTKLLEDLDPIKTFVSKWRYEVSQVFENCSYFITATQSTKDVYTSIYPQLSNKPFEVISHGMDFNKNITNLLESPSINKPVRILVPGNIDNHKGSNFIKSIKKQDKKNLLEIHFMGTITEDLKDYGTYHGKYDRNEFCKIVNEVKPSFIGIFSIVPETYCYTLSEAWNCGIPVLTTKLGAQEERLNKNGGGWFLDHKNPFKAYKEIIRIIKSPEEYEKKVEEVKEISFKTTKEMAYDYECAYWLNLNINKHLNIEKIYRVALFVHGQKGTFPATAHIRLLSIFYNPLLYGKIVPYIITKEDLRNLDKKTFLSNKNYDCIVVQRDVLDGDFSKSLVKHSKEQNIKLLYEIDDDLLNIDKTHPEYEKYLSKSSEIEYLIKNADLVTVSTDYLKKKLDHLNKVKVIKNALDERLWFNKIYKFQIKAKTVNIGYMGSVTHDTDLNLVKGAIKNLKKEFAENGIELNFYVIGGMNKKKDEEWFKRIEIPSDQTNYPKFVQWLKKTVNWDIAIAPLTDSNINQSKSEIKYLDYSALGLAAVYSDVGPYHNTIKDGFNGLLVKSNNTKEWEKQIKELIYNIQLRENIKLNAQKDVIENYLVKHRVETWHNTIKNLVNENNTNVPSPLSSDIPKKNFELTYSKEIENKKKVINF